MQRYQARQEERSESINYAMVLLLINAVFISLLLTASILDFNVIETFKTFISVPALTLFSIFVIFTIQFLILSIINEMKITMVLSLLLTVLISAINYIKIQFRAEPLIPNDLGFIFDLPAIIRLITPFQIIMMSLLLIVIIGLITWLFYRRHRYSNGIRIFDENKRSRYQRTFVLILTFTLLFSMQSYQVEGSLLRKTLTSFGFKEYDFDILKSYRENGFINGYISNISDAQMKEPHGYNKAAIIEIMEQYQAEAERLNKSAKYESFEDISVIYILSESLSNPQRVHGVEIESNPLPFISNPKSKVYQGLMVPPVYGGTTSNTEFEILTGLSMKYLASSSIVPYKTIIPEFDAFPNIVSRFKYENPNAQATAVHSYTDRLFRRREVFDTFGFNQAIFNKEMKHQDKLGESSYISDEATFAEVLDLLETDVSQFMHVITMQNHSPFGDKYDSLYEGVHVADDEDLQHKIAAYTQGIHYSDKAIEEFINQIMALEQKVVVVYYGDHLPGLYNPLLELNTDPFDLYKTDFFITKNFDLDEDQVAIDTTINSSTVSALTHLAAGVELGPLDALNLAMNEAAIGGTALNYLVDDKTVQYTDLDEDTKALIESYKLIQYDLLIGEQHALPYLN